MINIGKRNILVEQFLDGRLIYQSDLFQNVYQRSNGTHCINYGNRKVTVEELEHGMFYYARKSKTVITDEISFMLGIIYGDQK